MANNKNLKPIRSENEAREKGRKGGKKSGETRRARKTLREELLMLLEAGDTQNKISIAMINEAAKGNVKAYLAIRDTVGEKPIDKAEIIDSSNYDPTVFISETELENPVALKEKLAQYLNCRIQFVSKQEEEEVKNHINAVINGG